MRIEEVVVTPELAFKWLERNIENNRRVKPSRIALYAREMRAHNWIVTGQGILFDKNGNLIDGQNRLWAVIDADMPVKMAVTFDCPVGSGDHVDLNAPRSHEDIYTIRGEKWITKDYIAIARILEASSTNFTRLSMRVGVFEMRSIIERHRIAIEFALSTISKRTRGLTTAPVFAAVASAWYSESDKMRLSSFMQRLLDGIVTDPRDSAVITLRDWLKEQSLSNSVAGRNEQFLKTQRVIKAFMNHERLQKLYTPTEPVYKVASALGSQTIKGKNISQYKRPADIYYKGDADSL